MSIEFDPREKAYFQLLEQNRELNERRAAAGLPPVMVPATSLTSDVESMSYSMGGGNDVPWHVGLGGKENDAAKTAVAEALDAEGTIVAAGLDWTVNKGPLWGGPKQRLVEGKVAIYRESDGKVLGLASPRYETIQNREVFQFMDSLVLDGAVRYETAGSLFGGRSIWILARMEEDWTVKTPAGSDVHQAYICAITHHDGSGKMSAFLTEVRVICRNTTRLALAGAEFSVGVNHKGNTKENLIKAQALLKVTTGAQRRYQEWMQQLAEKEVTADDVVEVQDAMFGKKDEETSVRRQNQIDQFLQIYNAESSREGSSFYALCNACTGFASHSPALRRQEDGSEKMVSLLYGPNSSYTKPGFQAIEKASGLALAGV